MKTVNNPEKPVTNKTRPIPNALKKSRGPKLSCTAPDSCLQNSGKTESTASDLIKESDLSAQ